MKKYLTKYNLIIGFVFFLFLALRLIGISTDMANSDALRWHNRSEDFFQGIKTGNLIETYQRYHPGVTLMWITSGVHVLLKLYSIISDQPYRSLENVEGFLLIDGLSKTVLVFILFGLLLYQYKLISLIFNRTTAVIFVFLLALEPYAIGISRWYHLTSLETFLGFSAFLTVLWWRKNSQNKYLVNAGILMGLAILTKFSSVLILLLITFIILHEVILKRTKNLTLLLYLFIPCILVFFVLFPALWIQPLDILTKLVKAGSNAVSGDYATVLLAENNPLLFYWIILAFKLSPLTLILLVIAVKDTIKKKHIESIFLLIYILTFLVSYSLSEQKIERYIIVFVPAILLLCAITINKYRLRIQATFLTFVFIFGMLMYFKYYPLLSLYYSPVFGGLYSAVKYGFLDTNGDYYAQAAFYLNSKGRDIKVYVPSNSQSFFPYFKGNLVPRFSSEVDYVVFSIDSSRNESHFAECTNIEKSYRVDNVSLLTILKCSD